MKEPPKFMYKVLRILIILVVVLWGAVFVKNKIESRQIAANLEILKQGIEANTATAYADDHGNSIKVEMTTKSVDEAFQSLKSGLPELEKNGVFEKLKDYKTLVVVVSVVNPDTGEEIDSRGLLLPTSKIGDIPWSEITSFDSLMEWSNLIEL